MPVGADLVPGARNAVGTCLRVAPGERVALITDRATEETAAPLAAEVRAVGAALAVHVLEDYGAPPLRAMGWVAGLARLSDLTGLGAGGA